MIIPDIINIPLRDLEDLDNNPKVSPEKPPGKI